MSVIAELAVKFDAYVVTDEVYEPYKHIYMQSLPGMRERTIVCNSLSKTYSITGWRLGYVIANPEIIDRVKKVHDFLAVGAAAPLMKAAVPGLLFDDDYYSRAKPYTTPQPVWIIAKKNRVIQRLQTYFDLFIDLFFGDDTLDKS